MNKTKLSLLLLALVPVLLLPAPTKAIPGGTKVQLYKGSLNFPIDMAWVKDTKKIFFTEKSGAIRVMVGGHLLQKPCAKIAVDESGESGLLGIALHPGFKENKKLYVFFTKADASQNKVVRYIVEKNECTRRKNIVTGLSPTGGYHNGGQLEFVNGKLYVSTGESHDRSYAQNKNSRLGKILRVNDDGSIPEDNPFGNAVWTYGHRNPFGLTHRPKTDQIYSSENGPECDDEINLIIKGENYGWGANYNCTDHEGEGTNPRDPIKRWPSTIAVTDPWWYVGRMSRLSGDIYVGDFNNGDLHRLVVNDAGTNITEDRIIHHANNGITDVSKGPGGWLYFLTSSGMHRIVPE